MNFSSRYSHSETRARAWRCTVALSGAAALFGCRDLLSPLNNLGVAAPRLYLSGSGTIIVSPDSMRGWGFIDDQANTLCTNASSCRLVTGPAGQSFGAGSAELATPTSAQGVALVLQDYKGTRFQDLTVLRYSTYRQTSNAGNNLAISLQVNVDYDLSDAQTGY